MAVESTPKKILLQKQIESKLYNIFPKTEATIVEYNKGSGATATVTTVAAELAQLATDIAALPTVSDLNALRSEIIGELGDNESLAEAFDTIKEISEFLENGNAIDSLTDILTDIGVASSGSGAGAVAATGMHADIETLQAAVAALQAANGTNVSKTKTGSADAGNGQVYLDGTLTTIYDDSTLAGLVGDSNTTASASSAAAWGRIKQAQTDITNLKNALGTSSDTASSTGNKAWPRLKNAETDIDNLQAGLGTSSDTAASEGTTAWARIKALEAVGATKVEDGTTNGYLKINGTDNAIQVYDDTAIKNALGTSADTAASTGDKAWPRLKNAETDIDNLQAALGTSSDTASASGNKAWPRLKNAETDIDNLQAGLGTSADTASSSGTTAWARIKAIEAQPVAVQYVGSSPSSPADNVLYLVQL